jgi:hypothetical protein
MTPAAAAVIAAMVATAALVAAALVVAATVVAAAPRGNAATAHQRHEQGQSTPAYELTIRVHSDLLKGCISAASCIQRLLSSIDDTYRVSDCKAA